MKSEQRRIQERNRARARYAMEQGRIVNLAFTVSTGPLTDEDRLEIEDYAAFVGARRNGHASHWPTFRKLSIDARAYARRCAETNPTLSLRVALARTETR